jgi:hypothetical protein
MTSSIQDELPLGKSRKSAGQSQAFAHVDPAYLVMFGKALRELIESRHGFTIDDVVEKIGLPFESGKNNSIGALITRAAADGLIEKAGFATARRPESHGRIIHRWIGVRK